MTTSPAATKGLNRLPLNTLAIALGVGGVAEVWSAAAPLLGLPPVVALVLWGLAAIALAWLIIAHSIRGIRTGYSLGEQLRHPAQGPLGSIAPIVGMLVGSELAIWLPVAGTILVVVSMIVATTFAGWLVGTWLNGKVELGAVHGGYLLPTVAGGFVAASAAAAIGLKDVGWAAFGVGTLFWAVMTTMVLARLISRPPLPDALVPTLAVLVAPPAVGGLALFDLTGHVVTPLSLAFAGLTVVLAAAQLALIPRYRHLPFSLGFWSFTFPTAAVVAYAITWLDVDDVPGAGVIAGILGGALTLFVGAIGIRSLMAIRGSVPRLRAEAVLTSADDIDAAMTRDGALVVN
jgi:tellurite resistance protein TehA-like permease